MKSVVDFDEKVFVFVAVAEKLVLAESERVAAVVVMELVVVETDVEIVSVDDIDDDFDSVAAAKVQQPFVVVDGVVVDVVERHEIKEIDQFLMNHYLPVFR